MSQQKAQSIKNAMLFMTIIIRTIRYPLLFWLTLLLMACSSGGDGTTATSTGGTTMGDTTSDTTSDTGGTTQNTLYTTGVWETRTAAAAGFDQARLQAAFDETLKEGAYSQAMLVIKEGRLVQEDYRGLEGGEKTIYETAQQAQPTSFPVAATDLAARSATSLASSWSVAKSITSLLIGIAIDQGHIGSLDTKASEHLSAWENNDDLKEITIGQLVDMRSGLVPICVNRSTRMPETCTVAGLSSGGDIPFVDNQLDVCEQNRAITTAGTMYPWLVDTQGMMVPRGTSQFIYSNCDPMILGQILVQATGMSLQEFANRQLFSKLNMTAHWWRDNMPDGDEHDLGYCCVDATPRDFAKIGQLILNKGTWGTAQVVSENYINRIRGILTTAFDTGLGSTGLGAYYGAGFWGGPPPNTSSPNPDQWIRASGFDGQAIAIDLENQIVVVRNSLYHPLNPNTDRQVTVNLTRLNEVALPLTLPDIAFALAPNPPASTFSVATTLTMVRQALLASQACPADGEGVGYSMRFTDQWNEARFPKNFPGPSSGRHFTSFVGGVHSDAHTFWAVGQRATVGVEQMAEDGTTRTLAAEVKEAGLQAREYVGSSSGVPNFRVSAACPLVTFSSMLAPTHDWFTGVSRLDLRNDMGEFVDQTIDVRVYDAGTEDGEDFSRSGSASNPHVAITRLTTDAATTDFADGVHRTTGDFIGQMIFTKTQ